MTHLGTRILKTARLTLRPFCAADSHDMYNNWASSPNVTRYLSWPHHRSETVTKALLFDWTACYKEDDFYNWAIEYKGHAIGNISVVNFNDFDECAEIGYCLGEAYWGQGFMPECCAAVFDFLFDEVGVHRICTRHAGQNPKSGRVMEKLGMRKEGVLKDGVKLIDGTFDDLILYGILKKEYLRGKAQA